MALPFCVWLVNEQAAMYTEENGTGSASHGQKTRVCRVVGDQQKSYADMDPIDEIRAIREEISREFPTAKAYGDYLRQKYPVKNPPPSPPRKGRLGSVKTKANARPAVRQRKSAAHT